jgi:hypothetical protein
VCSRCPLGVLTICRRQRFAEQAGRRGSDWASLTDAVDNADQDTEERSWCASSGVRPRPRSRPANCASAEQGERHRSRLLVRSVAGEPGDTRDLASADRRLATADCAEVGTTPNTQRSRATCSQASLVLILHVRATVHTTSRSSAWERTAAGIGGPNRGVADRMIRPRTYPSPAAVDKADLLCR